MAEIQRWDLIDEEDPYQLSETDQLGVLSSTREILEQGEYVWIDMEHVGQIANKWIHTTTPTNSTTQATEEEKAEQDESPDSPSNPPNWYDRYHFQDGTERTVNWLLLLDALNFCFWAEKGQPRWIIEYQGEKLNGYWALAASLTRAVEEGFPLWDATYLKNLSSKDLAQIFRGEEVIPLFEERLNNAHEVGQVLLEKYDGQFSHAIAEAQGSAIRLTLSLVKNFPSFNDSPIYRNRKVHFYKRAQICISDLHSAFKGKDWGALTDLDQLTVFADYKIPQVLRHFGVIEYQPALAERIDNQQLLEAGSDEEIEIRAATVWACELIRRELKQQGHPTTATAIDQFLWLLGQNIPDMRPYHRTRTIYY